MAGILSVSRTDLESRRKKLRQKRLRHVIQTVWRTAAVSGLAGSLLWVAIHPIWIVNNPTKQIVISGNKLLSEEAIESLLVQSNPQLLEARSLLRIDPSTIAKSLEQEEPIANADVRRRLFPPGLIVQIKERTPVAVVQEHSDGENGDRLISVGLLDINGLLMPIEKYKSLTSTVELPNLKVIGNPEQYRPYWSQIYTAVTNSPVKVTSIDWEDPNNIILKTDLGTVHLGSPSSHLPEQIKLLAQMRNLPKFLKSNQFEYLDLKNPKSPVVQMNQIKLKN
ncbi:MAG: FtsQ-type POTRA domain-containing protein [Calothrix sp. SM1_7_51]|nr:FtsQ-type POTRA domain-containing protein [Calothrix sp. SM1_7_51]